ncbi:hypothetical protein BD289DRAFT_484489 [Coniella lustricola]|uniref:Uncharacterized protein n=1 Tax=Coniella lustricola TaxID=2025994 RepID=A0A2T3A1R7_9PEZI|nr:hypothetical protein BD289DRAFT_484489 [Coniella lustricola]
MSFRAFALFTLLAIGQASPAPKVLGYDDVVVMREDGAVVMKKWEYQIQEDKRDVQKRKAQVARAASSSQLATRGCEESTEVQVLSDTKFDNWDVAMSPVIKNTGAGASVAVTKGYSISDSIQVSESVSASVEDFLTTTMSISVTDTWTTQDSQTFTFSVPAGEYGVVISNPLTRRVSGNVLSGCTDDPTTTAFSSDSYTSQTYGDLSWVTGVISICNSTTYPIPYCVGDGTHE